MAARSKKISKPDFEKEIQSMGLDSMNITFGDSKNATEINKIDRALKVAEDLKPKSCDCNYGITIKKEAQRTSRI